MQSCKFCKNISYFLCLGIYAWHLYSPLKFITVSLHIHFCPTLSSTSPSITQWNNVTRWESTCTYLVGFCLATKGFSNNYDSMSYQHHVVQLYHLLSEPLNILQYGSPNYINKQALSIVVILYVIHTIIHNHRLEPPYANLTLHIKYWNFNYKVSSYYLYATIVKLYGTKPEACESILQ